MRLSLETIQYNLITNSSNSIVQARPSAKIRSRFSHILNADPAAFNIQNYTSILHPDLYYRGQPMLPIRLKQARTRTDSINRRITRWKATWGPPLGSGLWALRISNPRLSASAGSTKKRITQWKTTWIPLTGNGLSAQAIVHAGSNPRRSASAGDWPDSSGFGENSPEWTDNGPGFSISHLIFGRLERTSTFAAQSPNFFLTHYGGRLWKLNRLRSNLNERARNEIKESTTSGPQHLTDGELEKNIWNRHLSTLSHLAIRPFRRWPGLLLETDAHDALRSPGGTDKESRIKWMGMADTRMLHFADAPSRKSGVSAQIIPPKMKLAGSEKKAMPDIRGELGKIERKLKNVRPVETAVPPTQIDIHQVSQRVYDEIERKLRIERERRGL
jgi:hypothetical protein